MFIVLIFMKFYYEWIVLRDIFLTSVSVSRGGARSAWSYTPSQLDNSLVANLNKLWSERIEIFAPVEFTRVSILTGIVKISLKVSCIEHFVLQNKIILICLEFFICHIFQSLDAESIVIKN